VHGTYCDMFGEGNTCKLVSGIQLRRPNRSKLTMVSGVTFVSLRSAEKYTHTPWPLVRKRNIPTERPPLVDEV
jgi:hypothetical protein